MTFSAPGSSVFFTGTVLAVLKSETEIALQKAINRFLEDLKTFKDLPNADAAHNAAKNLVNKTLKQTGGDLDAFLSAITPSLNNLVKKHPGLSLANGKFLADLRKIKGRAKKVENSVVGPILHGRTKVPN